MKCAIAVLLLFFISFANAQEVRTPDVIYGRLFTDVQQSGIFPDSKTFVDAVPLFPPDSIVKNYLAMVSNPAIRFSLKLFVEANFRLPQPSVDSFRFKGSVKAHVDSLWTFLERSKDVPVNGSSLVPLPFRYVVPGGRFREIYYWDSYFTMLGLKESGRIELMEEMVNNFAYLIGRFQHIPNGNRSYYLSRSQPPFFNLMVKLLSDIKGREALDKFMPFVEQEYKYWMNKNAVAPSAVAVGRFTVNRYTDTSFKPRQESYREDVQAYFGARKTDVSEEEFYHHIRAAACSGWDFSSRWFLDSVSLATINTADIIPVDLNCLLYDYEIALSQYYATKDPQKETYYLQAAISRKNFLMQYCYDKADGYFYDYNFVTGRRSPHKTLAGAFPLYFGLCDRNSANAIKHNLVQFFLRDGGLVTSLIASGQQWDAPNGWAPLQWMCITGLKNYGYQTLADTVAKRWMRLVVGTYKSTGKLLEKYNVEDVNQPGGGGEYPTQDGFGWTNGVLLALMKDYGEDF